MANIVVPPAEVSLAEFRWELLPERLRDLWKKTDAKYLDMSEISLRHEVRAQCGLMQKEFSTCVRIRIAFWEEYERAARVPEKINALNLFRGVCRNGVYYALYDRFPALLAWVISPLAGYLLQRKELEFMAEERMIEVLSISPISQDGKKVDSRLAKVQLDLYQTLQDRIYGAIEQNIKTEQKSVNVNVNSNVTPELAAKTISLITNVQELDRRIKAIQQKRESLQAIVQPIEIDHDKLMKPDA